VFVKFEKKFWKNVRDIFIANDKKGYFPQWIPIYSDDFKPILMGITVGDEAKRLENADLEDVKLELQ
jgi:hypothetical protein